MKAYHFLKDDMMAGHGNEPAWHEGEERDIGDDNLIMCERGYHSSPSFYDALPYAEGNMACIVKVSKPIHKGPFKQVSRRRKLIKARNIERELRAFACDCEERERKHVKDKQSWYAMGGAAWIAERKWRKRRLEKLIEGVFNENAGGDKETA